jgi:acyl carrier protein
MVESEKIIQVIFDTVDELNEQYTEEQRLAKSTVLFGEGGKLDSIGVVTLIVATEQKLEEIFGISLTLADEKAMSQERSPFRTIGSLADYIEMLIEESTNV